jgi:hypothetical protein
VYLVNRAVGRLLWSERSRAGSRANTARDPAPAPLRRSPSNPFIARRWASLIGPRRAKFGRRTVYPALRASPHRLGGPGPGRRNGIGRGNVQGGEAQIGHALRASQGSTDRYSTFASWRVPQRLSRWEGRCPLSRTRLAPTGGARQTGAGPKGFPRSDRGGSALAAQQGQTDPRSDPGPTRMGDPVRPSPTAGRSEREGPQPQARVPSSSGGKFAGPAT